MNPTAGNPDVQSQASIRDPRKLSTKGETLYELLGITKDASPEDIRKAYRKQALRCHPDKNPDDPKAGEKFAELNRANTILSDEPKKAFYDKHGSYGIYLYDYMGEDAARIYLAINNPCLKCLILPFCFLAVCCLGLCYFGCCCWCCCRHRKAVEGDEDALYTQEMNDVGTVTTEEPRAPISSQPIPLGPPS